MKKLSIMFVAVAAMFLSYSVAQAQFNPYAESAKMFTAGIGVSGWGIPIFARLDVPVADNITVGGGISYQSDKEEYFGSGWKHTIIGITARGNYHFNELFELDNDQIDLYGGLSLGYYIWNTKYSGSGGSFDYSGSGNGGLSLGITVGGRYFFSDKLGVNVEFGGGTVLSGGTIGLTFVF